ncbi:MAG: 2-alkenal reductase [Candidatus Dactylopiibacterium carminicum]|uniref:2-alkenal reductase n=1 Tax=Candidatus Dactylopiibacterium carminicum TaxID=857335 RepID=A0A272ENB1_9RHOO|nr:Do family serine endopeptidase [Candidatus Dactylopiibacterium carminicum]KAF7598032.1 2-alkenal reductase [Candidatus Dactylopiibacterium carminicum]PAS91614.1 MAG: 2-alkenal reductase [Candidatus Dactylopiibacterium carminicum]PAS96380.1 MAG: 2-alkenal reductase [Candidatus Dactylopiibacterium carminicum]
MQRLWLIFAQTVTVVLGLLFVINTLKPEWIHGQRPASAPAVPALSELMAPSPAPASVPTREPGSYAQAAARALPSVVHIFTSKEIPAPRNPLLNDPFFRHFFGNMEEQPAQRASGLGSGVVVSADGYILTNNHVIEAADAIEVALNDGRKFNARIIGRDPETDLAVLRIDSKELPAVSFAPQGDLRIGDVVLAIGNPFGVGQTVTMGIVSALGRSELGINTFENFIQTDAAINPGNSGGALIDAGGNLVGINTAIYTRSGGSQGIGFAIPADSARDVMEQIICNGRVARGWIGIQVQEITPELTASFRLPEKGALIAGIARNSPAHKAGITPGDVLVSINGEEISDARAVLKRVAALPPGQLAKIGLIRNGKTLETVLQIGQRPLPTNVQE